MDEIQMKWKRNANRTQFGRKFRAKPTRKGRKKAPFVGLWENGAKKRQPIIRYATKTVIRYMQEQWYETGGT